MRRFLLLFLVIACGCSIYSNSGSVNPDVRDYPTLATAGDIKKVDYYCNFEKIAKGDMAAYGDYCLKASNEDYVSRHVSFDVQSTNVYRGHLMQMVAMIAMEKGGNWQLRYYQAFSGNDYDKLMQYDIQGAQPTSFALLAGDRFHIVVSKADLLARLKIYPELTIMSLKAEGTPSPINDFNVKYQTAPYIFNIKYIDGFRGRILGLPDYQALAGKYDSIKGLQLNRYNEELERYWKNPNAYKYDPAKATVLDFALPQIGREKFASDGVETDIRPRPVSPLVYEGLLNDYLPPYQLERVELVYVNSDGAENIVKTFNKDDIMNVLISYEDHGALVYSDAPTDGRVMLRFVHKALAPAATNMNPVNAEQLGIGYIYSDIAMEIHTNLYVERYYQLNQLPRACVNEKDFISGMLASGQPAAAALQLLGMLDKAALATCTPAQSSMGKVLPYLR